MKKISKLQNSLIWQPTKPASYISISITRKDKNNLMLDITPTKLIPRKKAKSRPKNKRLEEVNITFKNKVVVKNIEITADGSTLNIIGLEHILIPHLQQLKPSFVELISYYNKNNKRKIIYRYTNKDNFPPGNLSWVLKKWTRFYAIDTNTKEIEGINVSVTSVIQGYTLFVDAGYAQNKLDTYYTESNINDGTSNPETFAICKLISKIMKEYPENKNLSFGIITDSELELIDKYNDRTQPLLPGLYLPPNFHIMYASAEAGRDTYIVNKMMAMCDQIAKEALDTAKITRS